MLAAVWPFRNSFIVIPVLIGVAVYSAVILLSRTLDGHEKQVIGRFTRRAFALVRPGH